MTFSNKEAAERFTKMRKRTQRLANEMDAWAQKHGVDLVITSTVSTLEEDKALGRVSATHREGRAFDIRTRDLDPTFLKEFVEYFRTLYNGRMGAITEGGKANLIVDKPHGTGPHLHVQIRRD